MALSDEEKNEIVNALDRMSKASVKLVITSIEFFTNWLEGAFEWIYRKIKNAITDIWNWIKGLLS